MSQISIVDLNPTVNLCNLSIQNLNQIHGGFGAAPPVGGDGLPLFDRKLFDRKWDVKPIKIEGRLIIPQ